LDHRLARRKRVRLAELADDPWLAATPNGLLVRACRAAGFVPHLAYLTEDPMAINSFVAAGLAVALTSRLPAPPIRAAPPSARGGPGRSIYAVTPPGRAHPLTAPFLAALRTAARSPRPR